MNDGTPSNGHGAKLPRRQEQAIAALLTCPTIGAAAKQARVSERTLRGWLQIEGFAIEYRLARRQALLHATAALQRASSGAVAALVAVMEDRSAPAPARVTAARTVLDIAYRASELEDLSVRLEALEERSEEDEYAKSPHFDA